PLAATYPKLLGLNLQGLGHLAAKLLRLDQGGHEQPDDLELGPLDQVQQRLTPSGAQAHLVEHLVQLAAQYALPLLDDLQHGAIYGEPGRDADRHEVERVRQRAEQRPPALHDTTPEPEERQVDTERG